MSTQTMKARAGSLASDLLQGLDLGLACIKTSNNDRGLCDQALARASAHLDELIRLLGGRGFRVLVTGDSFTFGGQPLMAASMKASRFMEALLDKSLGGLDFASGARLGELEALVEYLRYPAPADQDVAAANQVLAGNGGPGLTLLPRQITTVPEGAASGEGAEMADPRRIYRELVTTLQEQIVRILQGETLQVDPLKGKVLQADRGLDQDPVTLMGLARCEHYDPMGLGHAASVCLLTLNFLRSFVPSPEDRLSMGLAGLVHNIGNVRLPFTIFRQPGELDREQRQQITRHPEYGVEILLQAGEEDPFLVATAFGHHREQDGGYPEPPMECPISVASRIIRICDIYTALTSPRTYRPTLDPLQAYRVMLTMKTKLDQEILHRFIAVQGLYPLGSRVQLSNEEEGLVLEQTKRPDCPLVGLERTGDRVLVQTGRRRTDVRVLGFANPSPTAG